jgi:hypothetical protein
MHSRNQIFITNSRLVEIHEVVLSREFFLIISRFLISCRLCLFGVYKQIADVDVELELRKSSLGISLQVLRSLFDRNIVD